MLTAERGAGQYDHFEIERAAAHLHGRLESMNRTVRERKMTNPIRAFREVSSVLEVGNSRPVFRDRRR